MTLNMQIPYERDGQMDGRTDRETLTAVPCRDWISGLQWALVSGGQRELPAQLVSAATPSFSSPQQLLEIYKNKNILAKNTELCKKNISNTLGRAICLCTINVWSGSSGTGINWSVGVCTVTFDSAVKKRQYFLVQPLNCFTNHVTMMPFSPHHHSSTDLLLKNTGWF